MPITDSLTSQLRKETTDLHTLELSRHPLRVRLVSGICSLCVMAYVGVLEMALVILVLGILAEVLLNLLHRSLLAPTRTASALQLALLWGLGIITMFLYMAPAIHFGTHSDVAVVTLSIIWVCGSLIYIANTYSKLPLFAFVLLTPVIISGFIIIALITSASYASSEPRAWYLVSLGLLIFGGLVVENVIRQKKSNNALDTALSVTRQQYDELRSVKQQLVDAVEGLDSGFALYDKHQQLVMHNSRYLAMHKGLSDLIQPGVHYATLLNALIERRLLLAPEKTAPLLEQPNDVDSIDITLADGTLHNIRLSTTAHGDRVSLITDITDAVQGQQKLRAMFDVSADAMFDCDLINNTVTFDSGFKTQFGHDWPGEHRMPSVWESTLHPDDAQRVIEQTARFVASRQVRFDIEYRMQRTDGNWAYVAQRTVALRDDNGKAVSMIGAVADLTEKRQLEDQLQAAQKMEVMGRISGGIAHDFNNLLAVIMGNAEYLQLKGSNPDIDTCIEEIVGATQRGAELTRRLLSFARRSRLAPQRIAPNEMVSGMQQLFSRFLPATIQLSNPLETDAWPIKVDPGFLESALLNLVINARDAMPNGGILTIETTNQQIDASYAKTRNETLAPGPYVMIAVSDTGHGIPKAIIERVIEPFFTTKGPNQGSGMGLSMVDGFVRQSGGMMRIYSEPGVGTTIHLLLPADLDTSQADTENTPVDPALQLNKHLRILLVEDEPKVRAVVKRILQDVGLEITEAASGDEALTLFANLPQPPDVLLTDVVMPGQLQGPALARKLKQQDPALQIIFMSGYANEAAINGNGLRANDHFLMKPIHRNDLLTLLAQLSPVGEW